MEMFSIGQKKLELTTITQLSWKTEAQIKKTKEELVERIVKTEEQIVKTNK